MRKLLLTLFLLMILQYPEVVYGKPSSYVTVKVLNELSKLKLRKVQINDEHQDNYLFNIIKFSNYGDSELLYSYRFGYTKNTNTGKCYILSRSQFHKIRDDILDDILLFGLPQFWRSLDTSDDRILMNRTNALEIDEKYMNKLQVVDILFSTNEYANGRQNYYICGLVFFNGYLHRIILYDSISADIGTLDEKRSPFNTAEIDDGTFAYALLSDSKIAGTLMDYIMFGKILSGYSSLAGGTFIYPSNIAYRKYVASSTSYESPMYVGYVKEGAFDGTPIFYTFLHGGVTIEAIGYVGRSMSSGWVQFIVSADSWYHEDWNEYKGMIYQLFMKGSDYISR